MILDIVKIVVLLGLIVWVCSLFTNAIEWTGRRFSLSEGAVGSVLAAVGTALPETLVPIIAIVSGLMGWSKMSAESGHDIGIGAILGAPFVLGTLAMGVTGLAILIFASQKKRENYTTANLDLFRRDLHYFFPAYIAVFGAAFVPSLLVKQIMAVGLLFAYGTYVWRTLHKPTASNEHEDLEALMFAPKAVEPATAVIMLQLAASLVFLLVLVHFFVDEINNVATTLGLSTMILSLIITPLATELPEKFNSVVWMSQRKDNLAMGNITGAMVFQSCIPTAIGLAFTPWVLNQQAVISVFCCLIASIALYLVAWKRPDKMVPAMLGAGVLYLGFVAYAVYGILQHA